MNQIVGYEIEKSKGLYSFIREVYENGTSDRIGSMENIKAERAVELMNMGLLYEQHEC